MKAYLLLCAILLPLTVSAAAPKKAGQYRFERPDEFPLSDWKRSWSNPALQFVDDSHGWIMTDGPAWRTRDGGKTWEDLEYGNGTAWFLDAEHGWAAGAVGYLHATKDGGEDWDSLAPEKVDDRPIPDQFRFTDLAHGWGIEAVERREVMRSSDGGSSWSSVEPLPDDERPVDICVAHGSFYVAGLTAKELVLRRFKDGAKSEVVFRSPLIAEGRARARCLEAAGRLWVGSYKTSVFSSKDGVAWTDEKPGMFGLPYVEEDGDLWLANDGLTFIGRPGSKPELIDDKSNGPVVFVKQDGKPKALFLKGARLMIYDLD